MKRKKKKQELEIEIQQNNNNEENTFLKNKTIKELIAPSGIDA